jgi:hypothetical protein
MNARRPTSTFRTSRSLLLAALGLLGAAGCQSTDAAPPHARIANEVTATAGVVDVDRSARLITLRSEDGSLFAVVADEAVRNFDQIAKGDQLRVRYVESLDATLRRGEKIATEGDVTVVAGRAKTGEKPAGGVGVSYDVRVKIESVDRSNHIVVFSLPSGELRTVRAQRPEGRAFVEELKVGDIVQLEYSASVALAIEKV